MKLSAAAAATLPLILSAVAAEQQLRASQPKHSQQQRLLDETVTGTYFQAAVQLEGGLEGAPIDSVELSDGTVIDLDCEDLSKGQCKKLLRDAGYDAAESGTAEITVTGIRSSDGFIKMKGPPAHAAGKGRGSGRGRRRLAITGTRTVLAVRVVHSGPGNLGAPGYSAAKYSDEIFGIPNDPVNLVSQYGACSHNQLTFAPLGDRTSSNSAKASNIVNGVTTVYDDLTDCTTTPCDTSNFRNNMDASLSAAFGQSGYQGLADHIMHCLPPNMMNGIGYAYFNRFDSYYSNAWCNYPSIQMHEIGHNLYLHHSSEGSNEYDDKSGFMGYSYSNDDQKMCFNNAKNWQLGWFTDASMTVTDATSYQGKLIGQVNYVVGATEQDPVIVKIDDPGSSTDYYVGFNHRVKHNANTNEAGNLVTVQRWTGSGGQKSYLIAKLGVGMSHSIPLSNGKTAVVNVEAIDTSADNGSATVLITNGDVPGCSIDPDCDDGLYCNGLETCVNNMCVDGTPVSCDDGIFCNGEETCNEATDSCVSGSPVTCDDGIYCNGVETCDEATDSCVSGPPVTCDDGIFCNGEETCNEATDSCVSGSPVTCDDGIYCNGVETCDEATDSCVSGPPVTCDGQFCNEVLNDCTDCLTSSDCSGSFCAPGVCNSGVCVEGNPCGSCQTCNASTNTCDALFPCCGNGVCEAGEMCTSCPGDCPSGETSGAICGNGICEAENGESCTNCPSDCSGRTGGKPSNRYCCGNGNCSDSRCTSGGFKCTTVAVEQTSYCCGDGKCDDGETQATCAIDGCSSPTPAPPTTTPVPPAPTPLDPCFNRGAGCDSASDCCSGVCKGNGTCK